MGSDEMLARGRCEKIGCKENLFWQITNGGKEIEKTVFVINFSDGNIGYYDLNSEEIILKAKIDILMTTALMKQIKKTTN